jgi:hypothetical protein
MLATSLIPHPDLIRLDCGMVAAPAVALPVGERPSDADVCLRFKPAGLTEWSARFYAGGGRLTGWYQLKDPLRALVLAGGRGFVGQVIGHRRWVTLDASLILDVGLVEGTDILVATPVEVRRFDIDGRRMWRSRRLAYDGIEFVEIEGDTVLCSCWNGAAARNELVTVSLRDGTANSAAW